MWTKSKTRALVACTEEDSRCSTQHEKTTNVGYMPDFHSQVPHRNVANYFP